MVWHKQVLYDVASRAVLYAKCSRYPPIPGYREHFPIIFARDAYVVEEMLYFRNISKRTDIICINSFHGM